MHRRQQRQGGQLAFASISCDLAAPPASSPYACWASQAPISLPHSAPWALCVFAACSHRAHAHLDAQQVLPGEPGGVQSSKKRLLHRSRGEGSGTVLKRCPCWGRTPCLPVHQDALPGGEERLGAPVLHMNEVENMVN